MHACHGVGQAQVINIVKIMVKHKEHVKPTINRITIIKVQEKKDFQNRIQCLYGKDSY